jgi:hypothetical protein
VHTVTLTYTLSLSRTHCHSHVHTVTLTCTLSLSRTHCHSHVHTAHSLGFMPSNSLITHTHSHTLTFSLTLTPLTLPYRFRSQFPYYYRQCSFCDKKDDNFFYGLVTPTPYEQGYQAGTRIGCCYVMCVFVLLHRVFALSR